MMIDVVLASCMRLPEPDHDAESLLAGLRAIGLRAEIWPWDDPALDWTQARLVVPRSTWNYPLHPAAFLEWYRRVETCSRVLNPLEVAQWNLHKSYLLDLERRGVPVVATELVRRGTTASLVALMRRRGWDRVVVKPAVSAASFATRIFDDTSLAAGQAHLDRLVVERDLLIQPYLAAVEGYGERALVAIDGEVTHAVRKDRRLEGESESVSKSVAITPQERALAERALAAVERRLLYARIDMVPFDGELPIVMELELIEPSLYLRQHPAALEQFVAAIAREARAGRGRDR